MNTRGTTELQGQSMAFRLCNTQLQAKVPGGTEYSTKYPAGFAQMSGGGTADVSSTKVLSLPFYNDIDLFMISDCQVYHPAASS